MFRTFVFRPRIDLSIPVLVANTIYTVAAGCQAELPPDDDGFDVIPCGQAVPPKRTKRLHEPLPHEIEGESVPDEIGGECREADSFPRTRHFLERNPGHVLTHTALQRAFPVKRCQEDLMEVFCPPRLVPVARGLG